LKDSKVAGVKTYAFHLPENIFWNSTLNPENIGFCDNDCLGNGVQNISKCYGGISSFISQPHFLNAEDKFIEAVTGLNPNQDKHDFVIDFEPVRL
jgi:lysosome membrane protein 2